MRIREQSFSRGNCQSAVTCL